MFAIGVQNRKGGITGFNLTKGDYFRFETNPTFRHKLLDVSINPEDPKFLKMKWWNEACPYLNYQGL